MHHNHNQNKKNEHDQINGLHPRARVLLSSMTRCLKTTKTNIAYQL